MERASDVSHSLGVPNRSMEQMRGGLKIGDYGQVWISLKWRGELSAG